MKVYLFNVWIEDLLPEFLPYEILCAGTSQEEAKRNLIENMEKDGHTIQDAKCIRSYSWMILKPENIETTMSNSMISAMRKAMSAKNG